MKNLTPMIGALVAGFIASFILSAISSFGGQAPDNTPMLVGACVGVVTLVLLSNLPGNRKTEEASEAERTAATRFQSEPGRAALYIVRTGFVGKAAGMNLAIDGKPVAQLKAPRYTVISLPPGAHTLTASFGGGLAAQTKPTDLTFTANAGDVIALRITMNVGLAKNPVQIEATPLDAIRNEITGMKMTKPDIASI